MENKKVENQNKSELLIMFINHTKALIEISEKNHPEPQIETEIREDVRLILTNVFNFQLSLLAWR